MIEDRLMVPGGWDITLRSDTPRRVLDRLSLSPTATPRAGFGHVVITPARLSQSAGLDGTANVTAPTLLAASRYTGIYRAQTDDGLGISGPGPNAWVADEDGKGQAFGFLSLSAQTFQSIMASIQPYALIAGSIEAAGGSYTNSFTWRYLGEVMAEVLDYFGREYRINPSLTFDAGSRSYLYPTTSAPTVVARRGASGNDLRKIGVEVANLSVERDLDDFTTDIALIATGGTGTATSTPPYKTINGSVMQVYRIEQESITSSATANTVAQTQLNRFTSVHQEVTISLTDAYDTGAIIRTGDTIQVYDPDLELFDVNNAVEFRGEYIFPISIRVTGMRWPVESGMGVYLIHSDGTGAGGAGASVTDLTDWVEFETGDVTLEVGSAVRTSSP